MEPHNKKCSAFCVIVDFGMGSKVLEKSKKLGATGGTFFLGKGTVRNHLLDILGLDEVRKEILVMVIEEELEDNFHRELTKKFSFNKPNHGIAFSMPLISFIKNKEAKYMPNSKGSGRDDMKTEAIFTIVNKGLSDNVLEAAKSAGSTGGTVIHGRGSGSHETAKLFNIEIEPEKDIILILSTSDKTEDIVDSIRRNLRIDDPGTGVIFVLDVNRTSGLFGN